MPMKGIWGVLLWTPFLLEEVEPAKPDPLAVLATLKHVNKVTMLNCLNAYSVHAQSR